MAAPTARATLILRRVVGESLLQDQGPEFWALASVLIGLHVMCGVEKTFCGAARAARRGDVRMKTVESMVAECKVAIADILECKAEYVACGCQ